jgi:hypothetical protein
VADANGVIFYTKEGKLENNVVIEGISVLKSNH